MEHAPLPHQISEDLGTLDELWRGWKLRRGQLHDPMTTNTLGWTPSQVRALPYIRGQVNALQLELQRTWSHLHDLELMISEAGAAGAARKIKRREKLRARQLTTLSRPEQTQEPKQRRANTGPVAPGLIFGPVPGGITRPRVRAIPPGTQRDRK